MISRMQEKKDFPIPWDIFLVFQVFGVFPVSLRGGPGINSLLKLVSLLNLFLILIITTWSLYYAQDIFDVTNTLGLFVDIIQVMAPISTHFLICLESFFSARSYLRFWQQFSDSLQIIRELNGDPLSEELLRFYRNTRVKLLLFFWVPLFIEIRILWGIFPNFWFFSRIAAQFAFIGCRLSYLQLCFHIQIVNWLLQVLERELRRVANDSRSQLKCVVREMEDKMGCRRIQGVHKATCEVIKLTSTLNACYRWSLLANLTNNLLCITIAFYWNYRSLYFNNLIFQAGEGWRRRRRV